MNRPSSKASSLKTNKTPIGTVRVFVSSPGDVEEERRVLDEVIARINRTDGRDNGVQLEVWRWENDLIPQIGPPPQAVVDAQAPADYDIYLGILAHRFGTPTGRYGSGTEKEFRNALKRWGETGKPWILFYFKSFKVDPDELDLEQYARVRKFREQVQKKGIHATYSVVRGAAEGFFEQVDTHLRQVISELLRSATAPARKEMLHRQPTKPGVPKSYLQWLQRQCAGLDLLGLKLKEGRVLRLNQVYVPLTTTAAGKERLRPQKSSTERSPGEPEKPQLLLELLDKQSLYISGDAGSGKSTFCRWVAWLCCEGGMPERDIKDPEGYKERFPDALRGRLPVLVRLREFWEHLPNDSHGEEISRSAFEQSLQRWLEKTDPDGLDWPTAKWHIENGSALLIFDGVDEVPLGETDGTGMRHPRLMLLSGLSQAARTWIKAGNHVLVTSRPYGLSDADRRRLELVHAPIQDLADKLQELLVQRWFDILVEPREAAQAYARDMIQHVREREGIDALVANPMLLTAMCILYNEGKRLPQDKSDLYARVVDNVLFNRFRDQATIDKVRNRLCVVAHGMHTGVGLGEERKTPQAKVTFDEIVRILEAYREKSRHTDAGFEDLVDVRELLLSQTGLLLPRGSEQAAFYHLSIQEFLAAQRVWDLQGDRLSEAFFRHGGMPEWENTLSFVFGAQLAKSSDPDRSIRLVEELIEKVRPFDLHLQLVLGDCFDVLVGRGIRLPEPEEKFRQLCLGAVAAEAPLRQRHKLALTLGRIGDPRIVNDLHDRAAYVEIPKDKYFYQNGRQSLEKPFLISRYPITNSQFTLFVNEDGYRNARWWSEEGWKWRDREGATEPLFWRTGKWNNPSQPVVGVSFWEAEAFCTWAGGRLPTEREWEAAARGPDGYEYPWGMNWEDGICNTSESGLGVTSPVGIFPRSRSKPFGLEDMAGNVWEWCSDEYKAGSYVGRVVRGGSWLIIRVFAHCDIRYWRPPDLRFDYSGFRVVCSASPALRAGPARARNAGTARFKDRVGVPKCESRSLSGVDPHPVARRLSIAGGPNNQPVPRGLVGPQPNVLAGIPWGERSDDDSAGLGN